MITMCMPKLARLNLKLNSNLYFQGYSIQRRSTIHKKALKNNMSRNLYMSHAKAEKV